MRKRKPDTAASPPGKRDALTENFIAALQADWALHGEAVIANLRTSRPEIYSRMVAHLVPRKLEVAASATEFENMTEEELRAYIADNQPAPTEADLIRLFTRDPVLFSRVVAAVRNQQADPIVQIINDAPEAA
jgi:hypothetical protein